MNDGMGIIQERRLARKLCPFVGLHLDCQGLGHLFNSSAPEIPSPNPSRPSGLFVSKAYSSNFEYAVRLSGQGRPAMLTRR